MARITRRRVSRRSSKRTMRPLRRKRIFRRKRLSRRIGGASFYSKRIKPARKYNKGKLRLQRALVRGGSLPNETSTHVYYRGMATTNKGSGGSAGSLLQMYNDLTACDQTFVLNQLGGPCISPSGPQPYDNGKYGKFSYQDVWTSLYGKGLVMGSKIVVHVKKSLYPTEITTIVDAVNGGTEPYLNKTVPVTDLAYGFWYIRYRYHRASKQGDPPEPVGHPMWFSLDPDNPTRSILGSPWYNDGRAGEGSLWANQRDFMCDPTVTWIRDRLPRATKLKFSRAYDDHPSFAGGGSPNNVIAYHRKPMFPVTEEGSDGRIEYELELSNRPTKLIAAYSRRKHSSDENPLRNSEWQDLRALKPVAGDDINFDIEKRLFQVRVGYVGFTSNGTVLCNFPADRLGHYLDIQCSYKVRLRDPLVNPWTGEKSDDDPMGRFIHATIPNEPRFDELDPELDEGLSDDDEEDDPLEVSEVDEVLEG